MLITDTETFSRIILSDRSILQIPLRWMQLHLGIRARCGLQAENCALAFAARTLVSTTGAPAGSVDMLTGYQNPGRASESSQAPHPRVTAVRQGGEGSGLHCCRYQKHVSNWRESPSGLSLFVAIVRLNMRLLVVVGTEEEEVRLRLIKSMSSGCFVRMSGCSTMFTIEGGLRA